MRGISEKRNANISKGIRFGYIIIPSNIDEVNRRSYVDTCYKREKVSVLPENGGSPVHNCAITKSALKEIYFPKTNEGLGSGVCFMADQKSGFILVLDVVSKMDESSSISEHSYKIFKDKDGQVVSAAFDANSNHILINSYGKQPSKMKISLSGNKDSTFELNIDGGFSFDVSGEGLIKSRKGLLLQNKTSKTQKLDIGINSKLKVKNESESLIDILNSFLDTLATAIITTPSGPGNFSPDDIASLQELKVKFNNLLE